MPPLPWSPSYHAASVVEAGDAATIYVADTQGMVSLEVAANGSCGKWEPVAVSPVCVMGLGGRLCAITLEKT